MDFVKAVPTTDAMRLIYACQISEDNCEHLPGLGEVYLMRVGENTHAIAPNKWMIWFPETREYDFIPDEEFREHYTLYDNLPEKIKAWAETQPSYEEWVENCDKEQEEMDMDDFISKVEEMRKLQKDYFRVRAPSLLNQCKKIEREVDNMIDEYKGRAAPEQASLV